MIPLSCIHMQNVVDSVVTTQMLLDAGVLKLQVILRLFFISLLLKEIKCTLDTGVFDYFSLTPYTVAVCI